MWRLHGALESYKDVGTVISLPTLLAEGDRTPFSFLLSYEKMIEIMEQPKYARVAKSFITDDRTEAMRSEEHTSELQSRFDLVCRLLLEKKKIKQIELDMRAV